jgi:hypothetical protein
MPVRRSARARSTALPSAYVALGFVCACESSKSPASEPEPTELDNRGVLRAELQTRPADFPDDHVRAVLAWVDGRPLDAPETSSADDLRELRFQQNSDVAVAEGTDVSFPLQVRVRVEPVEPMHYAWLTAFATPSIAVQELGEFKDDRLVHSLPQAELVLYHDANHNERFDLLEPGEPGPGPDRVLAVASGRDADGHAVRNVVVNKQSPFAPPLELFVAHWGDTSDDGLHVVRISVPKEMPLAQHALLTTHGITMSGTFDKYWARNMAERDFVYGVEKLEAVEPIPLFAVEPAQKSWLTRACVPYPTGYLGYAKAPPAGAAVQCGADRLSYASHPDDYCGQSDTLLRLEWLGDPDVSWWPCDEQGLSADAPYVPASEPIGVSPLSLRTGKAYVGVAYYQPPTNFECRADILYDFDEDPQTHLPALAPPPGSQVMCYGRNALSFVPSDAECKRKFTYELSSDDIPGYAQRNADESAADSGSEPLRWDMRDKPPAWWPCDKQGKLIAGTSYKAPAKLPGNTPCPDVPTRAAPGGAYAPPPHSKIRCTGADSLIAVPLWSDHCDGRTETTLSGDAQTEPVERAGWKFPMPDGWPCDKDGKFVPVPGYEAL